MDDLKHYAVFAETVSSGSMSAAARRLGMSPSAVSQSIRALEQQMGVMLLHRSTRKLALTEAGTRCYPHCCQMVEAGRAAADSLASARDAPSGELRVSAPVGFAAHIASALAPLLAHSPQLALQLLVDDAMIDLIDARIDIAVRVGQLPDSNWVARPLCEFEMVLCAAPAYFARHGIPETPASLVGHHWLASVRETMTTTFSVDRESRDSLPTLMLGLFGPQGEHTNVQVRARIASNSQLSLQQMCEQGLGIARLAQTDVQASLARGALVRLLPNWRFVPTKVTAITPRREGEPAKVRAALEALKLYFAKLPGTAAQSHL